MKKLKTIALILMLGFLISIPGLIPAVADETLVTPNKLIVFKIGDSNYYTQEIGSDKVDKVKMDAAPLIKQSRTFVPVRFLGNALGVNDNNIKWDNSTRTATLKGNAELKLKIGHKSVIKDGKEKTIDVAPYIIPPGRTVLPARYVAEGLGFKVDWDSQNSLVVVYPAGTEKPDVGTVLEKITQDINTKEEILKNAGEDKGYLSDSKIADMYVWGKLNGFDTTTHKWKTQGADYTIQIPAYDMSNVVINIPIKDPSRATKDALLVEKVRSLFGDGMAEVVEYYSKNSLKNPDKYIVMPNEEKHGSYAIATSNNQHSDEFDCTILRFEFRKI